MGAQCEYEWINMYNQAQDETELTMGETATGQI